MVAEFPRGAEIGDAALCKKTPLPFKSKESKKLRILICKPHTLSFDALTRNQLTYIIKTDRIITTH